MALERIDKMDILGRIQTHDVWHEMNMILNTADEGQNDPPWFFENNSGTSGYWDKRSFGYQNKKMISFKTTFRGIENLIKNREHSYMVVKNKATVKKNPGERKIKHAKDGKPHIYLQLNAQTIKFEGTGETGRGSQGKLSSSDMTKVQELGSAWVFYQCLVKDRGKNWRKNAQGWMDLANDQVIMDELRKIWKWKGGNIDDGSGDTWLINFYNQQHAVIEKLRSHGACCMFDQFTHSNAYTLPDMKPDSFMDWIAARVGKMGVSGKDNWNPADIWLIQSKEEENARKYIQGVLDGLYSMEVKREMVNEHMRKLFQSRIIFGISLKKVTKYPASVKYFNHTTEFFTESWAKGGKGTDTHEMKYDGAICKLGLDDNDVIETQDSWFFVDDPDGGYYKFQIKGNSTTSMSTLKYEAQAEGAGEARLGKATVALVEDNLKRFKVGDKFVKDKESYAMDADQFVANKGTIQGQTWQDMLKCLQTNKVNLGEAKDADDAYSNLMIGFTTAPHVCNMKLQEIRWLCAFFSIKEQKKRDEFATNMVWLSMKAGRRYGPFAKVY